MGKIVAGNEVVLGILIKYLCSPLIDHTSKVPDLVQFLIVCRQVFGKTGNYIVLSDKSNKLKIKKN